MEELQVLDIVIPEELEDLKLPSPELVHYYNDYKERRIYINYDIDDSLFNVTKQILAYNREDKDKKPEDCKPIKIYIHSYGGELYQAYTLISTILMSKVPVYTINMGVAMSAGLLILLAGHRRFAMRYSTAMIHTGSGGASGTFEQMEEQQKNYKKLIDTMKDYILERTCIDSKTFSRNRSKDWYLLDKEQLELGVVNEIVTSLDDIL